MLCRCVFPPYLACELLVPNRMLLTWQAFDKHWRMNEYVKFKSESQRSIPENAKSKIWGAKIKKTLLPSPRQIYIFFHCHQFPEITSIILKISKLLKVILLSSLLFVGKLCVSSSAGKHVPLWFRLSMLTSPSPSPSPSLPPFHSFTFRNGPWTDHFL